MELTNSFEVLLQSFAPVFTSPSFDTFRLLMTGWILSVRHALCFALARRNQTQLIRQGKSLRFSKKLDSTRSTDKGRTSQLKVRSSKPSYSPPV